MVRNMQSYLAHHGILGQKWGVRRYQNEDGTRTAAGKTRYSKAIQKYQNEDGSLTEKGQKRYIRKDGHFGLYSINDVDKFKLNNKIDYEIRRKYWDHLINESKNEIASIIAEKDISKKQQLEKSYLESAMKVDATDKEISRYMALQREYHMNAKINTDNGRGPTDEKYVKLFNNLRSAHEKYDNAYSVAAKKYDKEHGSWDFNGEEWNKRMTAISKSPEMVRARAARKLAVDKLTGTVLQDIGFENTARNRELGEYIWHDD